MAGFSIDTFKSIVDRNGGYYKPNRFFISFTAPLAVRNSSRMGENIEFYCEGVNLPGAQIQTSDYKRYTYGSSEKRPWATAFSPLQIECTGDASGLVWNFFHNWMEYVLPHTASEGTYTQNANHNLGQGIAYEVEYKDNYVTDVAIFCATESGGLAQYAFIRDAYPTQVSDMKLHWGDNNTIARFGVQLDYTDWFRY